MERNEKILASIDEVKEEVERTFGKIGEIGGFSIIAVLVGEDGIQNSFRIAGRLSDQLAVCAIISNNVCKATAQLMKGSREKEEE